MKIFITAINSFIGNELAHFFRNKGFTVSGSVRNRTGNYQSGVYYFDLVTSENCNFLFDQDIVIHCAHDFSSNPKANINGTQVLLRHIGNSDKKKFIYISTFAAQGNSGSSYIDSKYQVECLLSKPNAIIVRPGLVIGSGGMFKRNLSLLKLIRIAPLIDNGIYPLPFVALGDLLTSLEHIATTPERSEYNLFYDPMISYGNFIDELSNALNFKLLRVPVSSGLIGTFNKIHHQITRKNCSMAHSVSGLKANANVNRTSHLSGLIDSPLGIADALRRI